MHYFAYGSNLCPTQTPRRCPGARPAGRAVLRDWRLILTTRGTANIVRARGYEVHGGLWRFEPHHLPIMDQWEGVSRRANRRAWLAAHRPDGTICTVVTYLGSRTSAGIGKPHYILGKMLPGAESFDLPDHYQNEIRSWLPRSTIGSSQMYFGRRTKART